MKRLKKEERTRDRYLEAAVLGKLIDRLIIDYYILVSDLLSSQNRTNKVMVIERNFDRVQSELEREILKDHPDIMQYTDIPYPSLICYGPIAKGEEQERIKRILNELVFSRTSPL